MARWTLDVLLVIAVAAVVAPTVAGAGVEASHRAVRARRSLRAHGHHVQVRHRRHSAKSAAKTKQPSHHDWSLPPLTKLFRASEKTEASLEASLQKLREEIGEVRQKDLETARTMYEDHVQELNIQEGQNQKLQEVNAGIERDLNGLLLRAKASELRKEQLTQENRDLYRQLEALKKSVNSQVKGLEDILQSTDGITGAAPEQTMPAPPAVPVAAVAAPAVEYCRCTSACSDLGWGQWCTVQSATCAVKPNCEKGGAANSCVTVDSVAGAWTRCSNIVSMAPPALLQVDQRSKDQEDASDEDDDEREDDTEGDQSEDEEEDRDEAEDLEICRCRTPCADQGWGSWCYLQSSKCRVAKTPCDMGGAAKACVASDPGGPWTRCSNLVTPMPAAAPVPAYAPTLRRPELAPKPQVLVAHVNPVEGTLTEMMAQGDAIRRQDQQSVSQLEDLFQQEQQRLKAKQETILAKKQELQADLQKAQVASQGLDTEVQKLESVNSSLRGQLHQLEQFLAHESNALHSSVLMEDENSTPKAAALQMRKHIRQVRPSEEADDDKDDDKDDDDDDDGDDDN